MRTAHSLGGPPGVAGAFLAQQRDPIGNARGLGALGARGAAILHPLENGSRSGLPGLSPWVTRSGRGLGHLLSRVLLELARVGVEAANAFAQLFDGHGVLVVLEAIGLLVEVDQR